MQIILNIDAMANDRMQEAEDFMGDETTNEYFEFPSTTTEEEARRQEEMTQWILRSRIQMRLDKRKTKSLWLFPAVLRAKIRWTPSQLAARFIAGTISTNPVMLLLQLLFILAWRTVGWIEDRYALLRSARIGQIGPSLRKIRQHHDNNKSWLTIQTVN